MSDQEKSIIPGAYVKLSFTTMTKKGEIAESTREKVKEGDTEKEVDNPVIIKVGNKEVFFEDELIGLKEGEEKEFTLPPDRAYGKRDPSKIERIPIKKLKAMLGGKKPYVGALLYDENNRYYGKIVYVGSRDAMIDRNHPFAGEEIVVKVKIHQVVLPDAPINERVKAILMRHTTNIADKIEINMKTDVLDIIIPSEITMKLSEVDLLRNLWVRRKALADELLRELNISEVRFIDEFKLEEIKVSKSNSS